MQWAPAAEKLKAKIYCLASTYYDASCLPTPLGLRDSVAMQPANCPEPPNTGAAVQLQGVAAAIPGSSDSNREAVS